jgi:hypothetical protein
VTNTHIKKWRARLRFKGMSLHLGYFDDELGAARAYNDAVIAHGLNHPLNDIPETVRSMDA